MEGDQNQMNPSLCRSGCGFYGNPKTDGLCSKCYLDTLKRTHANPAATASQTSLATSNNAVSANNTVQGRTSPTSTDECGAKSLLPKDDLSTASPTVPVIVVTPPSPEKNKTDLQQPCGDGVKEEGSTSQQQNEDKVQKKNKCHICRKKVGLTGITCRCGGLFCAIHRYSNEHNCSFDYKQLGAQEIKKNNPVIVGKKVNKI